MQPGGHLVGQVVDGVGQRAPPGRVLPPAGRVEGVQGGVPAAGAVLAVREHRRQVADPGPQLLHAAQPGLGERAAARRGVCRGPVGGRHVTGDRGRGEGGGARAGGAGAAQRVLCRLVLQPRGLLQRTGQGLGGGAVQGPAAGQRQHQVPGRGRLLLVGRERLGEHPLHRQPGWGARLQGGHGGAGGVVVGEQHGAGAVPGQRPGLAGRVGDRRGGQHHGRGRAGGVRGGIRVGDGGQRRVVEPLGDRPGEVVAAATQEPGQVLGHHPARVADGGVDGQQPLHHPGGVAQAGQRRQVGVGGRQPPQPLVVDLGEQAAQPSRGVVGGGRGRRGVAGLLGLRGLLGCRRGRTGGGGRVVVRRRLLPGGDLPGGGGGRARALGRRRVLPGGLVAGLLLSGPLPGLRGGRLWLGQRADRVQRRQQRRVHHDGRLGAGQRLQQAHRRGPGAHGPPPGGTADVVVGVTEGRVGRQCQRCQQGDPQGHLGLVPGPPR